MTIFVLFNTNYHELNTNVQKLLFMAIREPFMAIRVENKYNFILNFNDISDNKRQQTTTNAYSRLQTFNQRLCFGGWCFFAAKKKTH